MEEERIDKIVNMLYQAYGSSTGFLFGIEPKHKEAVKTIIKLLLENEEKNKTLSEDIDTAIKRFEESSNKKCSKGDGCYICDSCKTQLKKRIIYYLKRRK